MTILDYFLDWSSRTPDAMFLRQPSGKNWRNWTWQQVREKASYAAASLANAGLKRGDRVATLSANCDEWIICDIAIMMGGFVSVPLYANVNSKMMQGILKDSDVRAILIGKLTEQDWQVQKSALPQNIVKVTMDGYAREGIPNWEDFIERIDFTCIPPEPDDVMTIIYTSGTTGEPKGVVHTYKSIINAVKTASELVKLNQSGNRFISYLPLSHAAERGLNEAGCIYSGGTISFVESRETFVSNLKDTKPTHFFGVPRIWDKLQGGILKSIPGDRLSKILRIPILSGWIKRRIKQGIGLDKAEVILSGAAPIAPELMHWFADLDIVIREAYGLSEDFNVLSMNPSEDIRIGTVGRVFEGQDVFIDRETGEICQKCDWLMAGYHNRPDLTDETIVNGYLRTGDLGQMSDDGYLKIVGRVKDIFKTAKGEYISPAPLEQIFMNSSMVEQACVIGTGYPQPFILVVARIKNSVSQRLKFTNEMKVLLEMANEGAMKYQQLKKVVVVNSEWTVADGFLTPTLKVKRNEIARKYEPVLHDVFMSDEKVSWESSLKTELV